MTTKQATILVLALIAVGLIGWYAYAQYATPTVVLDTTVPAAVPSDQATPDQAQPASSTVAEGSVTIPDDAPQAPANQFPNSGFPPQN